MLQKINKTLQLATKLNMDTKKDPLERLAELKLLYETDFTADTYNALIKGKKSIGKTCMLETVRFPLLIHSFDPNGTSVLNRDLIKSGKIIPVIDCEKEDRRSPTAYKVWEKQFDLFKNEGLFEKIGTYCIDSLTFWLDAGYNEISINRQAEYSKPILATGEDILTQHGWQVLILAIKGMIKMCSSLPCDFILTAHASKERDEVTGELLVGLAVPPSMQIPTPACFSEYYYLEATNEKDARGNYKRRLVTGNTDKVEAGTRIGRNKFSLYEVPNFKYLLKKAGRNYEDLEI